MSAAISRFLILSAVLIVFAAPQARAQGIMQVMRDMAGALDCLGRDATPELCKGDSAKRDVSTLAKGIKAAIKTMGPTIKDPAAKAAFDQATAQLSQLVNDLGAAVAAEDPKKRDKTKRFAIVDQITTAYGAVHAVVGVEGGRPPPVPQKPVVRGDGLRDDSPVNSKGDANPATDFLGDQPTFPHSVLWNKKAFIAKLPGGKLPAPTLNVDTFVVGGGTAGQYAALKLAKAGRNVFAAEVEKQWGGNAKATTYDGTPIQNGASYFNSPEKNSYMAKFLDEIHVKFTPDMVHYIYDDPVVIDGKRYEKPYLNGTTPQNKEQFNKLDKFFRDCYKNVGKWPYPEIPPHTKEMRDYVNKLDKINFKDFLEKEVLGEKMDPDVAGVVGWYLQSANVMNLDLDPVSAAAGLNFLVGDYVGGMVNLPNGNADITNNLLTEMAQHIPASQMKTSTLAFDVDVVADGVNVATVDAAGNVTVVHANDVVFAAPPFVADDTINNLEPERVAAIKKVKVRPYLVATAVVNEEIKTDGQKPFDVSFFKRSTLAIMDPALRSQAQGITDPVFTYDVQKGRTVINGYWPLPYQGARGKLLPPGVFPAFMKKFQDQLENEILPAFGLSMSNVVDMQITRYGHPIPQAVVGNYADGIVDLIMAPFKDRVRFVGQTMWTLPGLESIIDHVNTVVAEILSKPQAPPAPAPAGADRVSPGDIAGRAVTDSKGAVKRAASDEGATPEAIVVNKNAAPERAASMKLSGCPFAARRATN